MTIKKLLKILKWLFWRNFMLLALFFALVLPLIRTEVIYRNKINFLKQKIDEPLRLYDAGQLNPSKAFFLRALHYFTALSKLYPQDAVFPANVGFCYFNLGEMPRSQQFYRRAIEMEPQYYTYYWDLGMVEYYLENYQTSADLLTQSLNKLEANVPYLLKKAKNEPNDSAQAILYWAMIKKAQFDEQAAQKTLASAQTNLKNPPLQNPVTNRQDIRLHTNSEIIFLKYFIR